MARTGRRKLPPTWVELLCERTETRTYPNTSPPTSWASRLEAAINERARSDIRGLIDDVFRVMIAFDLRFLVRAQWCTARYLEAWDKVHSGGTIVSAPPRVIESADRLARIDTHIMEIIAAYARVRQQLKLADNTNLSDSELSRILDVLRLVGRGGITPEADLRMRQVEANAAAGARVAEGQPKPDAGQPGASPPADSAPANAAAANAPPAENQPQPEVSQAGASPPADSATANTAVTNAPPAENQPQCEASQPGASPPADSAPAPMNEHADVRAA